MKLEKSYMCGAATEPLIYDTIGNQFDLAVERFGDSEALVVAHQNIRWTYSEYQHEIERLATGLLALGIEPGDRVGIWAPNCYEWCLTQFATAKIGAILVCINPAYRLYELEYALNKVQCRAIISAESFKSSRYLDMLCELAPELADCEPGQLRAAKFPQLETVIRMGEAITPGMFNFDEVCAMGTATEQTRLVELKDLIMPDDAINIQFTSGTTGNPKGATLSHCNVLNNGKVNGDVMRLSHEDKVCIPVPLYHCFGMVIGNLGCICHGATAVFPGEAFEPLSVLKTVAEEKCTALHGVPTMFIAELDHPEFDSFDLSSLRTGIMAGAPCPESVMKQVIGKMNMQQILIAYGQTELSPVSHATEPDDALEKRVGTVGKPCPHLETKIVDDNNRVVAIGDKGEICTRGYAVMRGYWDDAEKTRETIDEGGWLHSGDIGIMDDEGYVRVTGRIKDMIIRGGENIYPREVEEFLYTHDKIQEVQIVGVPDEKFGEQVCAWIKCHEGQALTEEEVRAYCKNKITHFKVPHYIRFVDDYPMTVTGKIMKFKMRDTMIEELGITI
ncbi:MAG: AMP-binding protein [Porticoccaceae bacterium]|nr:AMP-binding protein [Porticoccaceae bacterium]OUS07326.1 AMP-binding protein [Gammaproteobacteria bacterium 54_18_T64]